MKATEALLNKVKENIELIKKEFNEKEEYSKTSHSQRVSIWEKYGKVRMYIPRNAHEQAGYIDLVTGELNPTRPGNLSSLEDVMIFIEKLD